MPTGLKTSVLLLYFMNIPFGLHDFLAIANLNVRNYDTSLDNTV